MFFHLFGLWADIFCFLAKTFGSCCRNCILPISRNVFEGNNYFDFFPSFLLLGEKFSATFRKLKVHLSRRTIGEKIILFGKNRFKIAFGSLTWNFSPIAKFFVKDLQSGILLVQGNLVKENNFHKKFFFLVIDGL